MNPLMSRSPLSLYPPCLLPSFPPSASYYSSCLINPSLVCALHLIPPYPGHSAPELMPPYPGRIAPELMPPYPGRIAPQHIPPYPGRKDRGTQEPMSSGLCAHAPHEHLHHRPLKNRHTQESKNVRTEECKNGRTQEWKNTRMEGCMN